MGYPAASTPDSCGQLKKAAIHPHHRKSQPSAATSTFAVSQGFGREPAEWVYFLPLTPLFLMLVTGLYLFALPYFSGRRGKSGALGRRQSDVREFCITDGQCHQDVV